MRHVLGSRASIGGVLGSGRGAAAADWWLSGGVSAANAIAVYQPIGAASLAASYTNLANPGTYDAAEGTAPTWAAATGWTFANSAYLLTGILPASGWSAIARFSNVGSFGGLFGMSGGAGKSFIIYPHSNGSGVIYYNGGFLVKTPDATSGTLAVAGNVAYRNGSAEIGTMSAWTGSATQSIAIGAVQGASVSDKLTGKIQAVAIYNTTLSAAQVAAISTAMAALTG